MNKDQHYKNKRRINGYITLGGELILIILTLLLKNNAVLSYYKKLFQRIGVFLVF